MAKSVASTFARLLLGVGLATGLAWGLFERVTAAAEVTCTLAVISNDECGGEANPRCRTVVVSGSTSAEGELNLEIDWDNGAGFGENQNVGGPEFSGSWTYTYQDNGLRHIRVEAEDSTGAKCFVEQSEVIAG